MGTIANPTYPDFGPLVEERGWLEQMKVLFSEEPHLLSCWRSRWDPRPVSHFVRAGDHRIQRFFSDDIGPRHFKGHAKVAGTFGRLAVFVTFLFSMVAFRPLGRIGASWTWRRAANTRPRAAELEDGDRRTLGDGVEGQPAGPTVARRAV